MDGRYSHQKPQMMVFTPYFDSEVHQLTARANGTTLLHPAMNITLAEADMQWMRFRIRPSLFVSACMGLALVAVAPAVASKDFAAFARAGDQDLVLRGSGIMRYLFFDLYKAAFYLPEGVSADRALENVPKRLEAEYMRDLKKADFNRSVHEYISRNVSPEQYKELLPAIEEHNAMYRDVSENDRYALHYEPGVGTTLEYNGVTLGTVRGDDFAAALFSIWLGEEPINQDLKQQLLSIP